MKVIDLIKILEPHGDKELYHLMEPVISASVTEILDNKIKLDLDMADIFDSDITLDDNGYRRKTPEEIENDKKEKIRYSREFGYYFDAGDKVKFDKSVMTESELFRYRDRLDLIGEVIIGWTELHSFARGSAYSFKIRWSNGHEDDIIIPWFLIRAEEV
jgi:hypothetical protein